MPSAPTVLLRHFSQLTLGETRILLAAGRIRRPQECPKSSDACSTGERTIRSRWRRALAISYESSDSCSRMLDWPGNSTHWAKAPFPQPPEEAILISSNNCSNTVPIRIRPRTMAVGVASRSTGLVKSNTWTSSSYCCNEGPTQIRVTMARTVLKLAGSPTANIGKRSRSSCVVIGLTRRRAK